MIFREEWKRCKKRNTTLTFLNFSKRFHAHLGDDWY